MPEIDPKHFLYYPLGMFTGLALVYYFFDIPIYVVFIALLVVIGYFILLIYFELMNK
ncbi:hypothetical protein [Lacticigenium naphthae]|uniref:hypothetical protein n=1 Tax=Lacticigenium naphthae TaxID=515351 RepID=UPI0003F728B0|nr:hypothetical protein [Lacticigenium naphthae]